MKRHWEVVRAAAWLGWQIEANWADPFLFIAYSFAKPLATTLILFFMVQVVSHGQATRDTFLFLFLGNTFFLYVSEVLVGLSWAIFRDREDFETLKYVYLAPIRMQPYLAGRALTKIGTATLGAAVALLFGGFVLGLPISSSPLSLVKLVGVIVLGLGGIGFLGLALAGAALVMARHSMNLNEGLTGAFYLLCGAVFPIEVLPGWAQKISLALPFTYWLELIRRLLTGRSFAAPLRGMGDGALVGILALSTVLLGLVATGWFRWCEHTARARGLIDWKTNY
ncbi:MAG TPA: ABC transporter permease [Candidatus Eisenbacteria bacterium]|jgi:ABC-2 type transport system permease protein|nr:ABC transporter permease [Candidatus Eisenbacteria bacterium]